MTTNPTREATALGRLPIPLRFAFTAAAGKEILAFERVGDQLTVTVGDGITPNEACQTFLDMIAEHFPFWAAEYKKRNENA